MSIDVNRQSTIPIYVQIARQLRRAILNGEIATGERLTPERRLAALLGVNRTTVVNAYRELAAEGLVTGQVGRGTVVTYHPGDNGNGPHEPTAERAMTEPERSGTGSRSNAAPLPWPQLLASTTDVRYDPLLLDAGTLSARGDVVNFTTGIPSPDLYPITAINALLNEALESAGQALLQHTPTEGFPPLREALARWMNSTAAEAQTHIECDPEEVVVAAGAQQGLYLIARALIEPGDLVAIESPTYLGAAQVFRAAGARLLPIPVDRDGMNVDLLRELLPRRRPKLIYTLPTFQNPTSSVLSIDRRHRLLDLAARYQIPVVEDDPYGALRYDGRPLPSLFALDRASGREDVIYLSTMSKMLFPGFRIGWAVAPRPVIDRLTRIKQIVDLDTNALVQWAVWAFFDRGLLDDHLSLLRQEYPRRRDRMLQGLAAHGHGLIDADRPDGGLYIWARVPDEVRVRDLLVEAAHEGVAFAPGTAFYVDDVPGLARSTLRLNFTLPDLLEIDEGTRRLGAALDRIVSRIDAGARERPLKQAVTPIV